MALNMPDMNLSDILPRRIPVTEEGCEQLTCACYRRGYSDAMRNARERRHAHDQGPGLLLRLLAGAVFVVLFAVWLAGRG